MMLTPVLVPHIHDLRIFFASERQVEDESIRQVEDQGMESLVADTSADLDDDDLGIPPPSPPVPPYSYDHEVGGSSAAPPTTPPAIDPALAAVLQSLTQQ
jgi:hypothetical protein